MKTAEQIYNEIISGGLEWCKDPKQVAIQVGKVMGRIHVEAALKAAHQEHQLPIEDVEFTLNAYPLTKII